MRQICHHCDAYDESLVVITSRFRGQSCTFSLCQTCYGLFCHYMVRVALEVDAHQATYFADGWRQRLARLFLWCARHCLRPWGVL